jgi:hypothetical protein
MWRASPTPSSSCTCRRRRLPGEWEEEEVAQGLEPQTKREIEMLKPLTRQ